MSGSMVACALCKAQFPSGASDKQGHGCASSVYKKDGTWYVQGHYGSRLFDMNRYRFVGANSEWQRDPTGPMDPVCDVCVQVWLRVEAIVWVADRIL